MPGGVGAEGREGLQLVAPDAHLPGRGLSPSQRAERGLGDLLVPPEGLGGGADAALGGGRVRRVVAKVSVMREKGTEAPEPAQARDAGRAVAK